MIRSRPRLRLLIVSLPWIMLTLCIIAAGNLLLSQSFNRVSADRTHQSISPPINQPINRLSTKLRHQRAKSSINQSVNQPVSQSFDVSLVVLDAESPIVQLAVQSVDQSVNQSIYQSINRLRIHVPSIHQSSSLFELLIATIINQYNKLPDAIFVLSSVNQSINQSLDQSIIRLMHSSSINQLPSFFNLKPGSYHCHKFQPINQPIKRLSRDEMIDGSIDSIHWKGIIDYETVQLVDKLMNKQSISQSLNQSIRFTCADRADDFMIRREVIQRYSVDQYKSMLVHCRSHRNQSINQAINQSINQSCDLSSLIHLLFDQSTQSLFRRPLLSSKKNFSLYQSVNLITDEIIINQSINQSIIGLSSRHPLYKRLTNPQYKHNHFYLCMSPSPAEIDSMNESINQSINSEQLYEWLRLMPVSLDPPTVLFAIFIDKHMRQQYNDTFDPQSINQLTNDKQTRDLMHKRIRMLRPDQPINRQIIKTLNQSINLSIPTPSTLFLQYIISMYTEPELLATCVIAYLNSYRRLTDLDEFHSDKLQLLLRAKWRLGETQHYVPLHVDSYTCESDEDSEDQSINQSINHSKHERSIIRQIRHSSINHLFPHFKGDFPSSFCYYTGGEFLTSRVAILSYSKSAWKRLLAFLIDQQSINQSINHGVTILRIAELVEFAMIPIWQMLFVRSVVFGESVVSTVLPYHLPNHWLDHPDDLPYLEKGASTREMYAALSSISQSVSELLPPQPNHWMNQPISIKLKTGQSINLTVTVVVAAFDENLSFVSNINPHYKRVILRQDFNHSLVGVPPVLKRQLLAQDQSIPHSIHLSGTGMCREASSYIQYIIAYYDELPDYSIFLHGSSSAWHHVQPIEQVLNDLDWDYIRSESTNFYHNLNSAFYTLIRPDHYLVAANHYFEMIGTHPDDRKRFFNGSDTLPQMIGYHQAAQFIVARSALHRHPVRWWKHLYQWCRSTHLSPAIASRVMEYSWHWIMGRPALEQRRECGTISRSEICKETRISD